MLVFLLTAVPLGYVALVMLLEAHAMPTRITVIPVVKGMISYAVIAAIMTIVSGFFPLYYHPKTIFLHFLMDQMLLPSVLLIGLFFLLSRRLWQETKIDRYIGLIAFFAGYYTVAGVVDLFIHSYYFSSYRLFLVPAIRLTLMILIPSGIVAFREERMFVRYLYLLAAIIGPLVGASVALLHTINAITPAFLAGSAFFVAGILVSYAMVRLYLPLRI